MIINVKENVYKKYKHTLHACKRKSLWV